MKEFILSLVSPLKIKKYRFMTVFIAMFIFVVSVYLVAIPNQMYMKINKDLYLSQKIYVSAYIDLPEEKLPAEFIAEKYKINDEYKMVSASNTKEIQKYYFENIEVKLYEEEMKSINIHIVFDLDNSVDTKLKAIREKYVQLYPDDSDNRKTYSAYITFVGIYHLGCDDVGALAFAYTFYDADLLRRGSVVWFIAYILWRCIEWYDESYHRIGYWHHRGYDLCLANAAAVDVPYFGDVCRLNALCAGGRLCL